MSFLEKEDEKKSPFWDWVIGIGLLVLVGGFTLYYQTQKRSTQRRFAAADTYEDLKDASYLTTANDSTIYARLDLIETIEESEREAVARLRNRLAAGDVARARQELDTLVFRGLLRAEDQLWVDSVKAALTDAAR